MEASVDPSRLPPEVWHHVCLNIVDARDILSLSYVSRWLYQSSGLIAAIRQLDLRLSQGGASVQSTQRFFSQLALAHLTLIDLDETVPLLARVLVEALSSLRSLSSLRLTAVNVPALALTKLSQLPNLTSLRLERMSLPLAVSGLSRLPSELALDLGVLTELRTLALVDVALSSEQCAFLAKLTRLRDLDLSHNPLRSRVLHNLAGLTKLRRLNTEGTQVQNVERFWTHLGRVLEERGKQERAVMCYDNALSLNEADQQALWHKALALTPLKRSQEALDCLDDLLEQLPTSLPVRLERGRVLRQLKRYRESIDAFDAVLELDADNLEAWWRKGASLIKIGSFRDAIECFDHALVLRGPAERFMIPQHRVSSNESVSLSPNTQPDTVFKKDLIEFLRGDAYYDLGLVRRAVSCWHRALVFPGEPHTPFDPNTNDDPMDVEEDERITLDEEAAIAAYDRALALNDQDESVWYTKAMILSALKRHEDAIGCFERAFELDPTFFAALDRHGESLVQLGRVREALVLHERVCKSLDPMRTRAWVNYATALMLLRETEQALSVLQEAKESVREDARLAELEDTCMKELGIHKSIREKDGDGNRVELLPER